jgi:hypothetical protein
VPGTAAVQDLVGAVIGPCGFFLLAAMPSAFHLLILARVYVSGPH